MKKIVAHFINLVLFVSVSLSFAACGGGGGSSGGGESYAEEQREAGLYLPSVLIQSKYKENTFSVGSGNVTKDGTIFSVFAKGGYFTLTQTEIEGDAKFNMGIPVNEKGVLLQDFVSEEVFNSDAEASKKILFRYIQYTSTSGDISFKALDSFLSSIEFHKIEGENLSIRINLETIPIEGEDEGSSYTLNEDVFYLDGSFYKKSERFDSGKKSWATAYNDAKKKSFNGLRGYLMAITSDAENKFIYDQVFKAEKEDGKGPDDFGTWIGGTRITPADGFDSDSWSFETLTDGKTPATCTDYWVWAAGPEAGQIFYTKAIYTDADYDKASNVYTTHRASGMYSSWSNPVDCYLNGIEYFYDATTTERGKGNGADYEPNNKTNTNHTSTTEEKYQKAMEKQQEYYAQYTGRYVWNDASDGTGTQGRWQVHYYITEFTSYGEQAPRERNYHAEKEYK